MRRFELEENGSSWYEGHKWTQEINYSSILTKLIQEAGRLCDYYASDLFIHWKYKIDNKLENNELDTITYTIGFRANGVEMFTEEEKEFKMQVWEKEFIKFMTLEIIRNEDKFTMKLTGMTR